MTLIAERTKVAAQMAGGTKTYGEGDALITALDDVDVTFGQAEFTAIMGPSGFREIDSVAHHCWARHVG